MVATLEQGRKLRLHAIVVGMMLLVIWTVKIVEVAYGIQLSHYGMLPRDWQHLPGILTMPLLHKDFEHLYANSFGVLVLTLGLFVFYEKVASRVLIHSVIWGGLLVWIFARPNYHIGASGLIYSMIAFLVVAGILRRDRASVGMMLITALLYGGAIWGVLPIHPGISWEGHLFGAVTGAALAIVFRKVDLPTPELENTESRYIDPDEVDDIYRDPHDLEETEDDHDDEHFLAQMFRPHRGGGRR